MMGEHPTELKRIGIKADSNRFCFQGLSPVLPGILRLSLRFLGLQICRLHLNSDSQLRWLPLQSRGMF